MADHRVWIALTVSGEHRTDGNIVGRGFVRFDHLLGIVRRNSKASLGTNDRTGAFRLQVVLPNMQPIKTGSQAKVGAIVEDEHGATFQATFYCGSLFQHPSGIAEFVSVLEDVDTGEHEFVGCSS